MPSGDGDHDSRVALEPIVRRYHRVERSVSWLVALLIGGVAAISIVSLPFLTGLLLTVVVLAVARMPLVRRRGSVRLVSDRTRDAVEAEFTGPNPPILAFQWGVADDVRPTDEGAVYDFSYALGLRSASMETAVRSRPPADDESATALEVTARANGRPWGRYEITIAEREEKTAVDLEWTTDRRFCVLALLQGVVTRYYYGDALDAQGYTVVERGTSLSL